MAAPANTSDCLRELIGQRIVGVLIGALPLNNQGIASCCKTLVVEDGRGFTFSDNGSFWIDSAADVRRALDRRRTQLAHSHQEIRDALALAGALEGSDDA